MTEAGAAAPAEDTVQRLAEMHDALASQTTAMQRVANRVTRTLGRPGFVAATLALIVAWVILNAVEGTRALERFPFPGLEFFATVLAFLLALIILSTQRHEGEMATKRAQLTLQIAVLSEKKIAKIIELLEEQRRDNPQLVSRHDPEAEEMATATEPQASLEKLEMATSPD